ncbi:uncharacterized protein LOC135222337 [Macrobrachium nipponense]|uniref:uncharacterized protein LOC135222337 n=1 Tax=Macrobrachium nipponense TaxID=159736 RepID=UPI0030C7B7EA
MKKQGCKGREMLHKRRKPTANQESTDSVEKTKPETINLGLKAGEDTKARCPVWKGDHQTWNRKCPIRLQKIDKLKGSTPRSLPSQEQPTRPHQTAPKTTHQQRPQSYAVATNGPRVVPKVALTDQPCKYPQRTENPSHTIPHPDRPHMPRKQPPAQEGGSSSQILPLHLTNPPPIY